MATDHGNHDNGKKQPSIAHPLAPLLTLIAEMQETIAGLHADLTILRNIQDERADKFAAMFAAAMARISNAITTQGREHADHTISLTTRAIPELAAAVRDLHQHLDTRIAETTGHLCTGLHGVATAIHAAANR